MRRRRAPNVRFTSNSGQTLAPQRNAASCQKLPYAVQQAVRVGQPGNSEPQSNLGWQLGLGINTDEDRAFAKLLNSPKGSFRAGLGHSKAKVRTWCRGRTAHESSAAEYQVR